MNSEDYAHLLVDGKVSWSKFVAKFGLREEGKSREYGENLLVDVFGPCGLTATIEISPDRRFLVKIREVAVGIYIQTNWD